MYMRLLYDERLAQAAYLFGCQRTGEAIVFDPERDVDRYESVAAQAGLRIVAVAETHVHADFLSGARELAERTGCRVYASGEGGEWRARWLDGRRDGGAGGGGGAGGRGYDHTLLRDGETFTVGSIEFTALHTPGHTPEHMCYLVTDRGSGATGPMGMVSGDFLFVGDLGRPDLLETAAGEIGAAEPAARDLFRSVGRIAALPDYLQVWPGHGAGSACGKALGAVPQSTLGYERRFNPALRAAGSESAFVDFILSGQPEPPLYFARMKRENRDGPAVLGNLPRPRPVAPAELRGTDPRATAVIDTRPWDAFRRGHIKGSILAPLDGMFINVVGAYVQPRQEIVLVAPEHAIEPAVRLLVRIGLDRVVGFADASTLERDRDGLVEADEVTAAGLATILGERSTFVLDVRSGAEFAQGHIPGAVNAPYARLPEHIDTLPRDRHIYVNCRSGARSARAVAFLKSRGFRVTNLAGGYLAWQQARGE